MIADRGAVLLGIVPADSAWGRFYSKQAVSGHQFYARARFYTLKELERLVRDASLRVERAASTLFQAPGDGPFDVEPSQSGLQEGAGFAALLCRRSAGLGEDGIPTD